MISPVLRSRVCAESAGDDIVVPSSDADWAGVGMGADDVLEGPGIVPRETKTTSNFRRCNSFPITT